MLAFGLTYVLDSQLKPLRITFLDCIIEIGASLDSISRARIGALSSVLKRPERHHLKLIVEGRSVGLTKAVCERLVELGLVRRDGDLYVATEDGLAVAGRK